MNRFVIIFAVVALGAAGCCFGGGSFSVSGPTTQIAPGFAPDPMLLAGSAGGPTDASTLHPSCRGHVGLIPNHTLQVSAAMPMLRVMAAADNDTTLVVRQPDGSYVCNDDSDGLNPSVDLVNLAPGAYNVFVGTYAPGTAASYRLGITTNASITPSTMSSAPPPAGGPIPGGSSLGGPAPSGPMGGGAASGTVMRSGIATVQLATGNLPGVTPGSSCTYTQTSVDASQYGFDCRWQVTCGGIVVYGEGEGGYNPCADPSWPAGTLVADQNSTQTDRDPSLVINAGGMMVRDDAQGARGEFQITATLAPMPVPPG